MSIDWRQVTEAYFKELPHPLEPALKIGEYAMAVKLATLAKFGGHATGHEAALFWPEFKATGMSPQEFEHTLERLAPLSFTYHGRPPTMHELASLKDKSPAEARKYFGDLPHKIYPHLSAAEMVKALQAAKPHAQEHLGREPTLNEAAYLHHSGDRPAEYYQKLGDEVRLTSDNVVPLAQRGNSPGSGFPAFGRQEADQRTSTGR